MSNSSTPSVAAGWYPDPAGSARSRWWDGTQWTEHYYDPATGVPVAQLKAPEGTKVYNLWIWLVVFTQALLAVSPPTHDPSVCFPCRPVGP